MLVLEPLDRIHVFGVYRIDTFIAAHTGFLWPDRGASIGVSELSTLEIIDRA